jgi:hypothetical protein
VNVCLHAHPCYSVDSLFIAPVLQAMTHLRHSLALARCLQSHGSPIIRMRRVDQRYTGSLAPNVLNGNSTTTTSIDHGTSATSCWLSLMLLDNRKQASKFASPKQNIKYVSLARQVKHPTLFDHKPASERLISRSTRCVDESSVRVGQAPPRVDCVMSVRSNPAANLSRVITRRTPHVLSNSSTEIRFGAGL